MSSLMRILAKIAAVAAVIAAAAAVLYKLKKQRDQEHQELDEYLMGSDDESPVQTFYVQENLDDLLSEDAQEWDSLPEDERVIVSFFVEPSQARDFQDRLAEIGVSSSYDEDNNILDIYISGPMDQEDLREVALELQKAAKSSGVAYQGYAFE